MSSSSDFPFSVDITSDLYIPPTSEFPQDTTSFSSRPGPTSSPTTIPITPSPTSSPTFFASTGSAISTPAAGPSSSRSPNASSATSSSTRLTSLSDSASQLGPTTTPQPSSTSLSIPPTSSIAPVTYRNADGSIFSPSGAETRSGSKAGPIVGGIIGGLAFLILLVVGFLVFLKRRKRAQVDGENQVGDAIAYAYNQHSPSHPPTDTSSDTKGSGTGIAGSPPISTGSDVNAEASSSERADSHSGLRPTIARIEKSQEARNEGLLGVHGGLHRRITIQSVQSVQSEDLPPYSNRSIAPC